MKYLLSQNSNIDLLVETRTMYKSVLGAAVMLGLEDLRIVCLEYVKADVGSDTLGDYIKYVTRAKQESTNGHVQDGMKPTHHELTLQTSMPIKFNSD